MIKQSQKYAQQVSWFTSLVSKKDNLQRIYKQLEWAGVTEFKTIDMAQGQKISRFVAWRF
jgi:23S rRNA (adenine1618-N6)-methyltransferase